MSRALVQADPAPTVPLELSTEPEGTRVLGFWMFLVTDTLIFASLFASYAVYHNRIAFGPSSMQVFELGPALLETVLLLTSSFTVGLAIYGMRTHNLKLLKGWLGVTMILGAGFVTSELSDFLTLTAGGHSWHQSAFLSAFFLLVGAHGVHVTFGILWAATLLIQVSRRGLTPVTARKLFTFSLYWHFLDIVWVFIFTFVYLGGKIP